MLYDRIPPGKQAELSALAGAMATASEAQILRALSLIDALEERGAADQLIEKMRPQLRVLRPPHPLRFPRLLLHPLDSLVISPTQWRPSDTTLPRNGLVRLAQHVRNRLGPRLQELTSATAGSSSADTPLIERLGRDLWPMAARILRDDIDAIPHLAAEVGQRHQRHVTLVTIGLLMEAPAVAAMTASTADGLLPPVPDDLAAVIDRTVMHHEVALPALMTILMARIPQTGATLDAMEPGPHAGLVRAAWDQATGTLLRRLDELGGLEAGIAFGTVLEAGRTARSLVRFLDQFADARAWRVRVQRLRARLETACQARLADSVKSGVTDVLDKARDRLDSPAVLSLEAVARGLRLLDEAARTLGATSQDALLRRVSDTIGSPRSADRLSLADRARLVEILAGPDAALVLLHGV